MILAFTQGIHVPIVGRGTNPMFPPPKINRRRKLRFHHGRKAVSGACHMLFVDNEYKLHHRVRIGLPFRDQRFAIADHADNNNIQIRNNWVN